MDFLDPKKRRAHEIKLIVGYILTGAAIVLATVLLLYAAYGFGLNDGQVVQNGLIFVSSAPSGAQVLVDGQKRGTTGERLLLQSGTYTMKIEQTGYRTWQRAVTAEGGTVEHIDYPFLFPTNLQTTAVKTYATAPGATAQSPDHRWILIEQPGSLDAFDLYDLSNPKQVAASTITLPSGLLTASTAKQQSLKLTEWAGDNRHVLLEHTYGSNHEYVLLDTQHLSQSVNITKVLGLTPLDQLQLQNRQYDHYFVYDTKTATLDTDMLSSPTLTPLLTHVLSFKTNGTDNVLYITDQNAPAGQVDAVLYQGGKSYRLRSFDSGGTYLLDLAQYSGSWFVAAGATSEGRVYVYKDPAAQLSQSQASILAPITTLRVDRPDYLAFSPGFQYVVAEHGSQFAVYDARYDKTYAYNAEATLDVPQTHASWMDGAHLMYVSGGKLVVFDYDSANFQVLMPASAQYVSYFDQNYQTVYALAAATNTKSSGQLQLTATPLTLQ